MCFPTYSIILPSIFWLSELPYFPAFKVSMQFMRAFWLNNGKFPKFDTHQIDKIVDCWCWEAFKSHVIRKLSSIPAYRSVTCVGVDRVKARYADLHSLAHIQAYTHGCAYEDHPTYTWYDEMICKYFDVRRSFSNTCMRVYLRIRVYRQALEPWMSSQTQSHLPYSHTKKKTAQHRKKRDTHYIYLYMYWVYINEFPCISVYLY